MSLQDGVFGLPIGDWRVLFLLFTIGALLITAIAFVAAASALRLKNIRKSDRWANLEQRWDEALEGVLVGPAKMSALLAEVAPGEELYFVDFLYRRARTAETRAVFEELARPHLHKIVERMKGGDAERRARAVQTVALLGFADYTPQVLSALDDESPLVAMVAARSLARTRQPEYVAAIIDRLGRFEDWSPRFLKSMLESMGPGAAPALRETLSSSSHPSRIRAVCAEALQESDEPGAADTAAAVIGRNTDSDVLAACLRLLRKLGSRKHVSAIRPLASSPDYAIRAQAIGALGRLGGPAEEGILQRALEDPSPWVALQAERALRERTNTMLNILAERVK